jgi:hypothetical protein
MHATLLDIPDLLHDAELQAGVWTIVSWSRGFPAYGSAPALPAPAKPWLRRWKSGPVRTRDAQNENDNERGNT